MSYYVGMWAAVFDAWLSEQMAQMPGAVVLHLGCGMDSRVLRIGTGEHDWYDVDFPEVIEERRKYYCETERYHMLGADAREAGWLEANIILDPVFIFVFREVCWVPR